MGRFGRLCLGLGILTLGLCAALPFRRNEAVSPRRSASGVLSTGLNVRGEDAPAPSMPAVPLLAMEAAGPGNGASALSPVEARQFDIGSTDRQPHAVIRPDAVNPTQAASSPNAVNQPRAVATDRRLAETVATSTEDSDVGAATRDTPLPSLSDLPRLDHPGVIPRIAETFGQAVENRASEQLLADDVRAGFSATPRVETPAENRSMSGFAASPVRLGPPVPWTSGTPGAVPTEGAAPREELPANATRGPLPSETAVAESGPAEPGRRHRIRDGDTLPELARRFLGDAARANEIFEANRQILSRPDVLPLGEVLVIPSGP